MQNAQKIETQTIPVVVDRYVASTIFGFLLECINGRNIYLQQSVFTGLLNNQISNKILNLYDDPLLPGSAGARPFDAEGIPCRKNILLENGQLKNYLLNTYSANKLQMKVNGLGSGVSNLILMKGTHTEQDIIKSIKKGLYLLKTIGQGTDPTTGGFSKGAYGIMIENGELTYPVSEITISCNIQEMLNGISIIANNPDTRKR